MSPELELLTVGQVAMVLHLARGTVDNAVSRVRRGLPAHPIGRAPWMLIGRRRFLRQADLIRFLDECRGTPSAPELPSGTSSAASGDAVEHQTKRTRADLQVAPGEQPS